MKRSRIIVVAVVLLLILGAVAYMVSRKEDKTKTATTTKPTSSKTTNTSNFAPVSTTGLALTATISTPLDGGTTATATLVSDGKGTTQYKADQGGQQVEITYTTDAYYMCTGGQCFKYDISQSGNSGFDPSSYAYTPAQLSTYRNTASYKGKKSCPAGTCDTWSVSSGGASSTIFIDTKTKYISQVESTVSGKKSTVTYEYKPVSITIPTNYQSITSTPQ
ncbi:MAG TPA: hypothetical protein VJC09_02955 [Candidatus Saccharimonadales bacterium]|nr:hypothetical protein [Candidatus Saccharimonadales bacterium]